MLLNLLVKMILYVTSCHECYNYIARITFPGLYLLSGFTPQYIDISSDRLVNDMWAVIINAGGYLLWPEEGGYCV